MSGFFSFDQESRDSSFEDEGCIPALSFKERMIGFLTCFGLSIFIDVISIGSMFGILTGNPTRFALSYTMSNILALIGSGFLLGFKKQMKSAFDEKRRWTSAIFFVSMIMTLVSVLYFQIGLMILVFIIIQVCAYIWYMASYFPWGREILLKCLKKCCGKCVDES
ncbi:unnamed protein product [Blepharisma stoltei]|uniref:Vesicle transport protein n=1 Tax=Blepharisma stoltei TaxID=1481888 RepID=A0AAU9KA82_9CILI|nr:unnamed protein product [Blepharisma stoltei]